MGIQLYKRQAMPGIDGPKTDFTLFVGPVTCVYHNCGGSIDSDRIAAFCPSDVQHALGDVEDAVVEAVEEVLELTSIPIRSITLFTACQSAFAGIDFSYLESRMRDEFGLLCLHRQRNRIMMREAGGGYLQARDRADEGAGSYERLLSLAPKNRVPGGDGLLVMAGSAPFDQRNELVELSRAWGFDWVMGLGDVNSLETLNRVRNATFIIVTDDAYTSLAQVISARWGAEHAVFPLSYDIELIDAAYRQLEGVFGGLPDVTPFREGALEALGAARRVCAGRGIEIEGPEVLVEELKGQGVDLGLDNQAGWHPAMRPRSHDVDEARLGDGPERRKGQMRGHRSGFGHLRSGDEHFPTSGPRMQREGRGGPSPKELPERGSMWGYFALYDCASRLAREVRVL